MVWAFNGTSYGEWDEHYTADRSLHSDDGELIMITGIRDNAVKAFDTSQEMFDYCYASGWTKSEEL